MSRRGTKDKKHSTRAGRPRASRWPRATASTNEKTAACKKSWCVCLAAPESEYCAAHRKHEDLRPLHPQDPEAVSLAKSDCEECHGTGECSECDGDGTHTCEHFRCRDEHDCGACDGTGKCQECVDEQTGETGKSQDALYLEWVAEAAWQPWQPPNPWDEATA